jgi:hypothetical protein
MTMMTTYACKTEVHFNIIQSVYYKEMSERIRALGIPIHADHEQTYPCINITVTGIDGIDDTTDADISACIYCWLQTHAERGNYSITTSKEGLHVFLNAGNSPLGLGMGLVHLMAELLHFYGLITCQIGIRY